MDWTVEEEDMLSICNHGSRISTLCALEEVLSYVDDDPDMKRIAVNVEEKLSRMNDLDFMLTMLESAPAWEEEEVPTWEKTLRKKSSV